MLFETKLGREISPDLIFRFPKRFSNLPLERNRFNDRNSAVRKNENYMRLTEQFRVDDNNNANEFKRSLRSRQNK